MPRGWEGNHRSGVALAMRHRLKGFIHLRAQRPRVGVEHPTYAPAEAWLPLPLIDSWVVYFVLGLDNKSAWATAYTLTGIIYKIHYQCCNNETKV